MKKKLYLDNEKAFVHLRSLFGNNWAYYFALLGARQAGKSYAVMKMILNKWTSGQNIKSYWIRLTEPAIRKLLLNNAAKLIDPDLLREFNLELETKGNDVYAVQRNKNGKVIREGVLITVLALSTFYNDKGIAYFDKDFDGQYIVVCDEMNREKSEKNTFDIVYNFKNQLENILRNTGSDQSKATAMIIMIGNTLSEASDMLLAFGFLPNPGEFGRYKLRSKKCIIDYLPLTKEYKKMREGSAVDILNSSDESTFKNEIETDRSLLYSKKLIKPQRIIKFNDDKSTWFTIWDNGVIQQYKNEQIKDTLAMRRYIQGEVYIKEQVDNVYELFDSRSFKYKDYYTQQLFRKQLRLLKPQK